MKTAKIFTNGGSQAIRLPKEFRFSESEVCVEKIGNTVIIFPKTTGYDSFLTGLNLLSDDFLTEAGDVPPLKEISL